MTKRYYETLMLMPVEVSAADLASVEKQLSSTAELCGGKLASFDKWGRYRLAYPVRKQEYGVYVLARYELEDVKAFFQKVEAFLRVRCVESVFRYTHVLLTAEQFNAPYVKPESMEAQAARGDAREQRAGGRRPFGPRNRDEQGAGAEVVSEDAVVAESTEQGEVAIGA